jgi:hypothetical protein
VRRDTEPVTQEQRAPVAAVKSTRGGAVRRSGAPRLGAARNKTRGGDDDDDIHALMRAQRNAKMQRGTSLADNPDARHVNAVRGRGGGNATNYDAQQSVREARHGRRSAGRTRGNGGGGGGGGFGGGGGVSGPTIIVTNATRLTDKKKTKIHYDIFRNH